MNVLLVVNVAAGAADEAVATEAAQSLGRLGDVAVVTPSGKDAFDDDVRAAARDRRLVVVAGGDGTLNCTVNALRPSLDQLVLGLIPMGTGNDLARTLGLPDDPLEACDVIVEGAEMALDVGLARGSGVERLFVNACVGGIAVQVDEVVEEEALKDRFGRLAFWLGGAQVAMRLQRFDVEMDGASLDGAVAVGVGNGRSCGGGIEVWPSADPSDGVLEGCVLAPSGAIEAAHLAVKVKRGSHEELSGVRTTARRRVEISTEPSIEINVDGELVGLKTPARFEVLTRTRIRAPS